MRFRKSPDGEWPLLPKIITQLPLPLKRIVDFAKNPRTFRHSCAIFRSLPVRTARGTRTFEETIRWFAKSKLDAQIQTLQFDRISAPKGPNRSAQGKAPRRFAASDALGGEWKKRGKP
jgi:hypothetical protein